MAFVAPTVLITIFLTSILLILFGYKALSLTDYNLLKTEEFDKHKRNTNSLVRVSATALISHGIKVSIAQDAAYLGNKAFSPNPVYIKTADTITWIDNDIETHTLTSGAGFNDRSVGKLFDSGILDYTQSFSHTFNTRGELYSL